MNRRDIAGSSISSIFANFLMKHQIDFQSGCTSSPSHQQWRSVPLLPHPPQHLLATEFLFSAILTGVKWNLRVVLICISVIIKDVEHFFRCFSAIQYSSVENFFVQLCLYPIFNGVIWFSGVQLLEFFIYIGSQSPIRFRIDKDLFQICLLPFCLTNSILCLTEAQQFHQVSFVNCRS